jgi:hypothetical protein
MAYRDKGFKIRWYTQPGWRTERRKCGFPSVIIKDFSTL